MKTLIVDSDLRERLHGLDGQMEVRNEDGQVVGMYLPLKLYHYFLANLKLPFSDEEIEGRWRMK